MLYRILERVEYVKEQCRFVTHAALLKARFGERAFMASSSPAVSSPPARRPFTDSVYRFMHRAPRCRAPDQTHRGSSGRTCASPRSPRFPKSEFTQLIQRAVFGVLPSWTRMGPDRCHPTGLIIGPVARPWPATSSTGRRR